MPATKEKIRVDQREGYIGGSDAGALLGLSPFASPMTVFADKLGLSVRTPPDKRLAQKFYFGNEAEAMIGKAVKHFHGIPVKREGRFWRAKDYAFMGGHLDWVVQDERAFVECKNIQFMSAEWGEPVSPDLDASALVPRYYLAQCDHYLYVTDFDYCYIAALVGGCDLKLYRIYRDAGREKVILEIENAFWDRVQRDDPPMGRDYDDFALALKLGYIKGLTAKEAKQVDPIFLDAGALAMLRDMEETRAQAGKLYKAAKELQGEFIKRIDYKFGYLCDKHGEVVGSVLSQTRRGFDDFALKMKHPKIYAKFETSTTFPVIRVRGEKDEPGNATD